MQSSSGSSGDGGGGGGGAAQHSRTQVNASRSRAGQSSHQQAGGKASGDARRKLDVAGKKAVKRRVRITIGLGHRKMTSGLLQEAVELFEKAEQSCLDLQEDGLELLADCLLYTSPSPRDRG